MQFIFFGELKFYGMYFEKCESAEDAPFIFGFHGGQGTPEVVSSIHENSGHFYHSTKQRKDK